MQKIIKMPQILSDNVYETYNYLANLQNTIIDCPENEIVLDFSSCQFSHAIFTAFIGSLSVWAIRFKKEIIYRMKKNTALYNYFKRSGLYSFITGDTVDYTNGNTIPFRKVLMDDSEIMNYIDNILRLAPVQLSGTAEAVLFKNIYEIFNNSVDHSNANDGVYACGHWLPNKKELVFSVYDTGIGIPQLIKNQVNKQFTSKDALEWALVKGNSTKQLDNGIPRGLGLSDLKSFIRLNKGTFNIVSNDVYYSYNQTDKYIYLDYPIIGTMISFIIRNDEEHIYFAQ